MFTSTTKRWSDITSSEKEIYKSYTNQDTEYSSPFYQFDFISEIAQNHSLVEVLILYKKNIPVLFLPYQYKTKLAKSLGLAERIGTNMNDYFSPIIKPKMIVQVIDFLKFTKFNRLPFDHFPIFNNQLSASLHTPRIATRIIIKDGGSDEYFNWLKIYNKKFLNDTLRRKRKFIKEVGELTYTFNNTDIKELETLITLKQEQYQRTNVTNSLSDEWKKSLLYSLFKQTKSTQIKPVLSTLYCGDKWLASHFGIVANGIIQFWFPVYNPEYKKYAPGRLLLFSVIENMQANNIHTIDRGEGLSDSKADMANFYHKMAKGEFFKYTFLTPLSSLLIRKYWKNKE